MIEVQNIGALSTRYFEANIGPKPLIAIFRGKNPEETVQMCRHAWSIGIELVEVPIQGEAGIASFRAARDAAREHGKQVGVGTVLTIDQVRFAVDEGAAFAVSPGLDVDLAQACGERGLPLLPGVATSSEIGSALRLGLVWQKAFPAAQLGPGWITAQLAPFSTVLFVATGGIDASNAAAFLTAGARAVAAGSALSDPEQLAMFEDLPNPVLGTPATAGGDAS
ncbi:MAG TPA: bifunctional 4-hydroxy-2-oxoglutarate aldolase/2-dehydro-3-deoxy-phosphogluconate aldolase [Nocardioidaceae bacterium]|nr:bifunctional 4-hydroxy-2-oxoglutarate aldolase/2-dehydro-3-deoxy-phosphogluconate aldolase [Nocardioidaceae bacterium]